MNILYFENDPTWGKIVQRALAHEPNIELDIVSNYTEVGKTIHSRIYSLIIIDLILNDDNPIRPLGLEIAAIVNREIPDIPIIILSSALTVERIYRASQFNTVAVIIKEDCKSTKWLANRIKAALPNTEKEVIK